MKTPITQTMVDVDVNQTLHLIENQPFVEDDTVCYGTSATLEARFGHNINWFGTSSGGRRSKPIYRGSVFETSKLYEDTTFYVSNTSPNGITSARIPVNVVVKPRPTMVINDSAKTTKVNEELLAELYCMPSPGSDFEPCANSDINAEFVNFRWFRNGDSLVDVNEPDFIPKQPGEYYMEAEWVCQGDTLGPFSTNAIRVFPECDINQFNTTYINGGEVGTPRRITTITDSCLIGDTLTIQEGSTVEFVGNLVRMQSCAKIIVEKGQSGNRGAKLILDNVTLEGCSDWQGITVQGDATDPSRSSGSVHGKLEVKNQSHIKNAYRAIESVNGGLLSIDQSVFEDNHNHIAIRDYPFQHNSGINENSFRNIYTSDPSDTLCFQNQFINNISSELKIMMYLESVQEVAFSGNEYRESQAHNGNIPDKKLLLAAHNAANNSWTDELFVEFAARHAMYFDNNSTGNLISDSHFKLYTINQSEDQVNSKKIIPISFRDSADNLNIHGNNFEGPFDCGIDGKNSQNVKIENNVFGNRQNDLKEPYNGIYLKDVRGSKVAKNEFNRIRPVEAEESAYPLIGAGVQSYMPNHYPNSPLTIKENKFNSTKYGLVMAPEQNPLTDNTFINQATHRMNIRVTCNTFKYNNVGLIGSGNLRDQVHTDTAASNFFNDLSAFTPTSMNYNWDILWQDDPNGNAFTYYWGSPNNNYAPNDGGNLNFNSITLNGTPMGNTDHSQPTSGISNGICGNSARQKKAASNEQTKEKEGNTILSSIYPNPTRDKLYIEFNKEMQGRVKLQTLSGKTMLENTVKEQAQVHLNTRNLSAGIYLVSIKVKGEIIPPEKVVIMK